MTFVKVSNDNTQVPKKYKKYTKLINQQTEGNDPV